MSLEYWERRYREHPGIFAGEPNAWVVDCAAHIPAAGRVLCIGDGEGRNSRYLAQLGFDVTAVEWSSVAVARAKRGCRGVHHYCADAVDWAKTPASEGPWAAIVWIYVVTSNDAALARQLVAELAHDGLLIAEASATMTDEPTLRSLWDGLELRISPLVDPDDFIRLRVLGQRTKDSTRE